MRWLGGGAANSAVYSDSMHIRAIVTGLIICSLSPTSWVEQHPTYLPKISSRAEFNSLSRVTTTPYSLPHVLFLIDREHKDRVYYIDSKRPWHHREFANAEYLTLENNEQFLKNNYYRMNRRFILGWVAYYTPIDRWGFECWEGDQISSALISEASIALNKSFFTSLAFKPNSLDQENASQKLKRRILPGELTASMPYQPLNIAQSIGRVRILSQLQPDTIIEPDDILVLDSLPIGVPPVAGLISAAPSSPLSHLSILSRSWGIPVAYVKGAAAHFKKYDGQWISLETKSGAYTTRLANQAEISNAKRTHSTSHAVILPDANLNIFQLRTLEEQRATSVSSYGTKSANLGEVAHGKLQGIIVPAGFSVPFAWYASHLKRNGLDEELAQVIGDPLMKTDAAHRRERLAALRAKIEKAPIDPQLAKDVLAIIHRSFTNKGLFVRSSTNAEDLPTFSGAGLYTTVPIVKGDDAILAAIRTVWASVWNDDAYAAREQAGMDHKRVYMAVLLQEGINADSAGVMITADPFNHEDHDAVFISAKRGLGIKVVEGQKVPEQLILHRTTNAVQVLTRSQEDSLLTFDPRGGVKEIPTYPNRAVLTDELVRRLAKSALDIRALFNGVEQDIEWAQMNGTIYIVQSRPYRG